MKKWISRLPYFIFVVGIGMDIYVNLTGSYKISVTESYMDYIFAGIITVSVLCFSFVALIAGFFDKKYFGYKLRDIIQFSKSPVNMKKYICVSLITIIIGVTFLAGDFAVSCANGMTALLVALVCLEGNVAIEVYEMLTNEEHICDLVLNNFSVNVREKEMDLKEFQEHTNNSIGALKVCIEDTDFEGKNKVCNMFAELGKQISKKEGKEDYFKYYNYFDEKIKGCMNDFAITFGYNEMLNFVVNIYTQLSDFEYGRIDLYLIPLENIRFWSDQDLLEKNYFQQIGEIDLLEIYKKKQILNSEVERIFFTYFKSIMGNCICSENVRNHLVEMYIAELMKLHWQTNEEGIDPDISGLLNILKYYVLKNSNISERNYVFKEIVKQAFYNNMPYNKEKYFDFLAFSFQAFYAFIFREEETLNEKYREGLKKTFETEFESETISKMSAALLMKINIRGILLAMGRRVVKEYHRKIEKKNDLLEGKFENFPAFSMAKCTVWTLEFNVDYLFMLYLVFYDQVGFYSIYKGFFEWDTLSPDCQIFVLEQLQNKFDIETGKLQTNFVEKYEEYGALLKHSHTISEQKQKHIFEHIMEEHTKLKSEKIDNQDPVCLDMDYSDVMAKVNDMMRKDEIFGWNPGYSTECYVKFILPDCICRREYRTLQNTARTIKEGVVSAVQRYIQQRANKLTLSFDFEGVKKLLDFINENDYNARNCSFTNDLALGSLRNEADFKCLEEKLRAIELVNTPQFYENMYFRKEKFCFNVKISKIEFLDLTERECANFLESNKCYNGLYNVDGALMAKEQAMKSVRKIYCKERYYFKLMIELDKGDVTRIEYKY